MLRWSIAPCSRRVDFDACLQLPLCSNSFFPSRFTFQFFNSPTLLGNLLCAFSITSHTPRSLTMLHFAMHNPSYSRLSSFIALHFTAIHSNMSQEQRTSPPCSAQHWDNVPNLEKFLQKMRSVTSPRLSSYELTSCTDKDHRTLPRRGMGRRSLRRTLPRRT